MNKIALPIKNEKLGSPFESCNTFFIYSIDKNNNLKKELAENPLQPGMSPYWLASMGITDVIAKEIDVNTIGKFDRFKINVFAGVRSDKPDQLIQAFLDRTLETFDPGWQDL
jgi:predicted Fe-Mo cluster-binding NifX family protein